jgi:hypothetical protein
MVSHGILFGYLNIFIADALLSKTMITNEIARATEIQMITIP